MHHLKFTFAEYCSSIFLQLGKMSSWGAESHFDPSLILDVADDCRSVQMG